MHRLSSFAISRNMVWALFATFVYYQQEGHEKIPVQMLRKNMFQIDILYLQRYEWKLVVWSPSWFKRSNNESCTYKMFLAPLHEMIIHRFLWQYLAVSSTHNFWMAVSSPSHHYYVTQLDSNNYWRLEKQQ